MAYAPTKFEGTTGTFEYTIGFDYAQSSDIKVYVNGVLDTDWYFTTNGTKIKWDTPDEPQTGEDFIITRVTAVPTQAVEFTNGSGITDTDMNLAMRQCLFAIEELVYPAYTSEVRTVTNLYSTNANAYHGMGAIPTRWHTYFVCKTADLGYTAGDVVDGHFVDENIWVYFTPTQIKMNSGTYYGAIKLPHATTRTMTAVDGAKWYVVVKAWR
jgi:hypothetical protein